MSTNWLKTCWNLHTVTPPAGRKTNHRNIQGTICDPSKSFFSLVTHMLHLPASCQKLAMQQLKFQTAFHSRVMQLGQTVLPAKQQEKWFATHNINVLLRLCGRGLYGPFWRHFRGSADVIRPTSLAMQRNCMNNHSIKHALSFVLMIKKSFTRHWRNNRVSLTETGLIWDGKQWGWWILKLSRERWTAVFPFEDLSNYLIKKVCFQHNELLRVVQA